MEDLYTRAWCLVEYIYVSWLGYWDFVAKPRSDGQIQTEIGPEIKAQKFGFYKDKVLITGPNQFSETWFSHV